MEEELSASESGREPANTDLHASALAMLREFVVTHFAVTEFARTDVLLCDPAMSAGIGLKNHLAGSFVYAWAFGIASLE